MRATYHFLQVLDFGVVRNGIPETASGGRRIVVDLHGREVRRVALDTLATGVEVHMSEDQAQIESV